MKVTASIICDAGNGNHAVWRLPYAADKAVLDIVLDTLEGVAVLDGVCVFTNDADLTAKNRYGGLPVQPFWPQLGYRFNFLDNIKLHNECFSLEKAGFLGDVHLFWDVHHPLLRASSLTRMFNSLMEDQFAAKIIPVYPIDPHLYMQIGTDDRYVALWGQQGLDRQHHPRLLRSVGACFVHRKRLQEMQPMAFPFEIGRLEGTRLSGEEDLDLIRHIGEKFDHDLCKEKRRWRSA